MNTDKTTFAFILKDKVTGTFLAGPFMAIDQVAKDVDWNAVTIQVTNWFDPRFGQLVPNG